MTAKLLDPLDESSFERIIEALMLIVFWIAFTTLGVGLVLWLAFPASDTGMTSLAAGLLGLLLMPLLRLVWALAAAIKQRDWLMLGATLIVMGILLALTLRDAVRI